MPQNGFIVRFFLVAGKGRKASRPKSLQKKSEKVDAKWEAPLLLPLPKAKYKSQPDKNGDFFRKHDPRSHPNDLGMWFRLLGRTFLVQECAPG